MINFDTFYIKEKLVSFLKEDVIFLDKTSDNLEKLYRKTITGEIISKSEGILCGIEFAKEVFLILDKKAKFKIYKKDGQKIYKNDIIMQIKANARQLLKGERLALDIIQRLSGIATLTNIYAKKIKKYKTKLVATRKATPGFAVFEKYATLIGGANLHRYNLFDSVLIKDNHIAIYDNNIESILKEIKNKIPFTDKIEIEVQNLEQFYKALENGADIIMLDNMSIEDIKKAVNYAKDKNVILEASGGINIDNIEEYAKTGIDIISSGAIIHQAKWLDISLNVKEV